MKLRFNISEPTNTGSPDYIICNQASVFVSLTNLGLILDVGGTNIITTNDLSSVSFPTAPIVTTNGVTVIANLENSNYIRLDLSTFNLFSPPLVNFQISKTGYYSYTKSFEVYGNDLGQNPNLFPTTQTNPDFTLYLINQTNNSPQTHAFSSFIAYRKLWSENIYFYKSNSGIGSVKYINGSGDVISNISDGFVCSKDDYKIKQITNIGNDICMTSLKSITHFTFVPPFEGTTSCTDCDTECIVINTNNTTITNIDFTLLDTFAVDDNIVYPLNSITIDYNLIDFTGQVISTQNYSFNLTSVPEIFVPSLYPFNFVIPSVGDYIIQVVLSTPTSFGIPAIFTCTKNYPIKSCNSFEIQNTECNQFTIFNKGFTAFDVEISELQNDKTFLLISTITVPPLSSKVITHIEDNIFTYTINTGLTTLTYIVVNYCNLRTCLLKELFGLICSNKEGKCCDDCSRKNVYDFNALIINAHTYFNLLNSEYNFNYIYESLTPNKIDELFTLKSFLVRFKEYCESCNHICNCNKTH